MTTHESENQSFKDVMRGLATELTRDKLDELFDGLMSLHYLCDDEDIRAVQFEPRGKHDGVHAVHGIVRTKIEQRRLSVSSVGNLIWARPAESLRGVEALCEPDIKHGIDPVVQIIEYANLNARKDGVTRRLNDEDVSVWLEELTSDIRTAQELHTNFWELPRPADEDGHRLARAFYNVTERCWQLR